MNLSQIEKRILEIVDKIANAPGELDESIRRSGTILKEEYTRRLKAIIEPLQKEKEKLNVQRRFILDRRESWLPKIIWNILVPILVATITAYLVSVFR